MMMRGLPWVMVAGLVSGTVLAQTPGPGDGKNGTGKVTPPVLQSGQTSIVIEPTLTLPQQQEILAAQSDILKFVSKNTGLPIVSPVKGRFVSRGAVNKELRQKFDEDKSVQRMERSELVLKKFGLLDPDFHLRPFLLSLLTEQIAGFYDNKTKVMNLLDWVPIDEQKSVMAHELTHALQDQKVNLTKWSDNEIEGIAKTVGDDNRHIQVDEADTAREAVTEGQAMISFGDYALETHGHPGKTLKDFPQVAETMASGAGDSGDSPVLARAPLVIQQALLFPYSTGLGFEETVLLRNGVDAAFSGVLNRPPSSSYEIMTPAVYLEKGPVPVMRLPDLHPMLKAAGFEPYDVGVMGELDVRMTAELFGGRPLAEALAPAWNGGIYYAAQRSAASAAEKQTTASVAILYSSQWKNADSARSFFEVFEQQMPRQYDSLKRREKDEADAFERVYSTREGDVLLTRSGSSVWVSEGFPVALARQMRDATDAVQSHGPVMQAKTQVELLGGLGSWMGGFGVVKAVLR